MASEGSAFNRLDPVGMTGRVTTLKHGAGVSAVGVIERTEAGYFVPVLGQGTALAMVAGLIVALGSLAGAAEFSNASSLLAAPTSSGVAMAVVDMDQDGKDDIVHFSNALNLMIDYQTAPGQAFDRVQLGAAGNSIIWGVAVGDADENGFPDIMTGGRYDGLRFYRAASGGRSFTATNYNPSIFLQGINFVDINGDGRLDVFACHDEGENIKMLNSGNANFVETPGAMNTGGYAGSYGSVWTDYDRDGDLDLYISKCSRFAPNDPLDPRRINQLFRNNGNGTYTEVAVAAGLAFGEQSWSADFADIDNDGDLDCFVGNHYDFSKLMRNNSDGTFSDITVSSGLSEYSLVIQTVFRDFDNDGWVDLLVTGEIQRLWRNNHNLTFTAVTAPFPIDPLLPNKQIESCAVGDLNRDGFVDVYAGYATIANTPRASRPDCLYLGIPNGNHFLSISLRGSQSNRLGLGAMIELHGPWGVQLREVRGGESYGVTHSYTQMFGLGSATSAQKLVVRWPSGAVDTVNGVSGDQFLTVVEGSTGPGLIDGRCCPQVFISVP